MATTTNLPLPVTEALLEMLLSDDDSVVLRGEWLLARQCGPLGVELLLMSACDKKYTAAERLRFLQVARRVGVPLNLETCPYLQTLVEDRDKQLALEAGKIVADSSPFGAKGLWVLPLMTGRPYKFKQRKKTSRTRKPRQL